MCFKIDPNHPKVKIAENDIVCYKIFLDKQNKEFFTTIYKGAKLKKKSIFNDVYAIVPNDFDEIFYGIHSYVRPAKCILRYDNEKTWNKWADSIQVKCIIPKGAKYYLNEVYDGGTGSAFLATYVSEVIIVGGDEDIIEMPEVPDEIEKY